MKKFKSINKRVLALLLSILMLLTSGIISAVAVTVDLADTGAAVTSDGTARLYFNMSAVSWWTAGTNGNGNFAYFMDSNKSGYAWSAHAVKDDSNNTYYFVIPSGTWSYVILTRNNTSTSPSWNNKWNQTGDITLSTTSNYLSKFAENSTSATWGTAVKPASTATVTASETTVAPNTAVTLTSALSSNADINTISSTTYTASGGSVNGNTFTATEAGTYTVTATVTYHPNGYSSLTSTATATTTITVEQSVVAPDTPAAPTVTFNNTYGGTGTQADPYLLEAGVKPSMTITGVLGDAEGLAYNVNYTDSKVDWAASETSVNYQMPTAPSLGNTSEVNTYLWAYNGSGGSKKYSDGYATTTQYIKGVYTATFNNSDNEQIGDTVIYDGTSISAPEAPSVDGYTFTGWTADDGTFYSKDTALAITKNTTFTATYSADPYSFDLTCDATAGSVTIDPENSGTVKHDDTITLTATANTGYKFTGWSGTNGTESISGDTNPLTITVKGDVAITANFEELDKFTVTVTNENTSQGTLTKMGNTQVYIGSNFTIEATPAEGYAVDYWTINGEPTDETGKTLTLENITANTEVSIVWKESTEVKVYAKPSAYGYATVTANSTAYTVTVESGTDVVLNAAYDSNVYEFVKWNITGKYTTDDVLTDANITIVPTAGGTITATAELRQIAQYVYAEVQNGWSNVNLYRFEFASDTGAAGWPGTAMTKYATKNGNAVYRGVVPLSNGMVIFNNGSAQTADLTFTSDKNYYVLNTPGGWSDNLCPGFFLRVNNEDIYMTETADGTFSTTYDFENTSSSQSVGASVVDFWKTAVSGATCTGTASAPCRVKYTFNPYTNELTYTVSEIVPQITVYLDNGTTDTKSTTDTGDDAAIGQTNASFADNSTGLISVGNLSYYKQDAFTDIGGYRKALVDKGSNLIFTTTMESINSEGVCDYKVEGWVINGDKFVQAKYMGKNSSGYEYYQGNYTFTEDKNTVVPIYFHTDAWREANGVETVKVYAVTDKSVTNWDKYMAAYVWYDSDYEQFGLWQGQLMIPGGLSGVYYTFVEKTDANKKAVDGITFNNFGYNGDRPSYPVTEYANIQTYDYSEFMKLLALKKENITFVLKPETDDAHEGDSFTNNINIANTYDFDVFTDASGTKPWDIHRNDVTSEDVGLYIVREFLHDPEMKNNDVGKYSIRCHLYKPNGTYIGYCASNELLDISTLAAKGGEFTYLTSEDLVGKTVKVAYESVIEKDNGTRYDGEWYGDADVNVKVNLNVQVGLTEDDGTSYTVDTDATDGLNVATYGSAFAEGGAVATVVKGKSAALKAVPAAGHKFIGWYSYTGEKLSSSITHTINDVSFDTTITAVFQALRGGEFVITHSLYTGGASGYNPDVFTGTGDLYIGVADAEGNDIDPLAIRDTLTFDAKENSTYIIKIATDPYGADKFYSWYISDKDKYGNETYEEVGVDNYTGDGVNGNLFDNGVDTIEGSNTRVEFWFKHTVDANFTSLDLFSSIKEVSANVKLVYKYDDRYGVPRSVTVPYVLKDEEVDNGYCPSSDTVKANAPYVDDYYTDVTWDITKINSTTFELWADQDDPVYAVTINFGSETAVEYGAYNSEMELHATDYGAKSDKGYWFEDDGDGVYEAGEKIVAYGRYYGLRITRDINLCYVEDANINFDIVLDEPVYTREQETDENGNITTDKIYIDYLTSILVPLFRNSETANGTVIKDTYYNGNVIPNANSPVTIETLTEHFGYEIEYGVILEQLKNTADFGVDVTEDTQLQAYLAANGGYNTDKDKYATVFNATSNPITNKNRILITIDMNNTSKNQQRHYNVYGYLKVKDNAGQTHYFFSDMRTLNIQKIGTSKGEELIK